jgi:hypothetical protein
VPFVVPFVVLGAALGCLLVLAGCTSDGDPRGGGAGRAAVAPTPTAAARFPASDVLRAWDRARGRAWAEGDVAALRRLYVGGSRAGTSDVHALRGYLGRGLRVEGMHVQLLALDVVREGPGLLRLLVTDRLVGAVAVGQGRRVRLPWDRATTRVVELRRSRPGDRWRVATVRESARRPAGR